MIDQAASSSLEQAPIASRRHSLIFLAIVLAVVLAGFAAQHRATSGDGLASSHEGMIPLYLSAIFMNGMLAYFVWTGVRKQGGSLFDLIGGRWSGWRDVGRDITLAALFWVVLLAAGRGASWMLGQSHAKTLDILLPQGALEVLAWIATSAMAGFSEELVFRGYVQRQILALSGSAWAAVVGQGVLFGLMHAYQGWKAVIAISLIGVLFGGLAQWRRTLRVGMLAHAWTDIWAGWLSRACGARF
ncbi:MAG TPA: type II CAAX endopeptidase family protein [Holophagaceae bacterium]|nr:type II CAAX endopeptidase family protein [Holophagaceae bacterium]